MDVPVKANQNHQSKENDLRMVSAQDTHIEARRTDTADCGILIDQRR